MRRTAGHRRSLLLLTGFAVTVAGCELMPDRQFAELEKTLTLKIADARRNPSGKSLDVRFEMTNHGSTSAQACLGPSRDVYYDAGLSSGFSSSFTHHAGCTREFSIESADVMSWSETLELSQLAAGRVQVEVTVQIVNPRRCGSSCAEISLKSNRIEIP